jgi:phosphatidate cytidylyltransferase
MGGLVFPAAFGFACYFGGNEFMKMVQKKGVKPSVRIVRGMIIAFFVVAALPHVPVISPLPQPAGGLPVGFPVINYQVDQEFPLQHFPLLLTVGIFISFFRLLFRGEEKNRATIADIASTILGFIYVGWMPAHIVLLRNLSHPSVNIAETPPLQHPGLAYVWVTLFIIWATDIFAYVWGKRFGKTKLMQEVSPKKTWEGAIFGFICSIFWAGLVVWIADNYLFASTKPFGTHTWNILEDAKFWIAPLMGAFVSVAAQLGDLCESLIKRDAGMKDSSDAIPGHGGVLDRGDSILFGAPISYYWIKIFFLGIF